MKIGLVINPLAGIGGPAAMKGSDDPQAQRRARDLGVVAKAQDRARHAFSELAQRLRANPLPDRDLRVVTPAGAMGADALVEWQTKNAEDRPFTVEVRKELLDGVRPAITTLFVKGLVSPDWLIEVEAVAAAE